MASESATGERLKQRIDRMSEIEYAALQEFAEFGYHEATAEKISKRAGVSVRTFFRHFPGGKEDVMTLGTRRWMDRLDEAFRERPPHEDAWTALRAAVLSVEPLPTVAGDVRMPAEFARLHYTIACDVPELRGRIQGQQYVLADPFVQHAALRMSVDPKLDMRPQFLVYAVLTAVNVAWTTWLRNPDTELMDRFHEVLQMAEDGIGRLLSPRS